MSIESPPSRYKDPYDSLDQACYDHERIALYTAGRLFSGKSVGDELRAIYDFNKMFAPDLIDRLFKRGVYLEPVDDTLTVIDNEEHRKVRVFNTACSLALQLADNFAMENDIDRKTWREFWANLPDEADAPAEVPIGKTLTPHDCYVVGASLLGRGQIYVEQMSDSYIDLLEQVIDASPEIAGDENIFRGSFGYVMGNAERVINTLISDRRINEDVKQVTDSYHGPKFDDMFKQFLRIARKLDKQP